MVDLWIIEEIRRQEQEKALDLDQPALEIFDGPGTREDPEDKVDESAQRGVAIIDLG